MSVARRNLKEADAPELAQVSQSIRNESRALVASLKKDAMNAALPPQLRETLRAGIKELRAVGVLAEKHAPKITATPRASVLAAQGVSTTTTNETIASWMLQPKSTIPGLSNFTTLVSSRP